MKQSIEQPIFQERSASYFDEKAKKAKGKEKMLVALEMSKYLTAARQHGLSFEKLKEVGFKFATV